MKANNRIFVVVAAAILAVNMSACSSIADVGNAGTAKTNVFGGTGDVTQAAFELKLANRAAAPAAAPGFAALADTEEDAPDRFVAPDNVTFEVTAATVNVRYIRFKAPSVETCADDDSDDDDDVDDTEDTEDTEDVDESEASPFAPASEDDEDDEPSVKCEGGHIQVDGPFLIDLMTGLSTPPLTNVTVPVGVYKEIMLRIDDAKSEDGDVAAGSPMDGRSMRIEGNLTAPDAGVTTPTPFSIQLKFDEEIEFANPAGVTVATDGPQKVAVEMNVNQWMSSPNPISLSKCVSGDNAMGLPVDASGVIQFGDQAETEHGADIEDDCKITEQLKENIKNSGSVEDGDERESEQEDQEDGSDDGE